MTKGWVSELLWFVCWHSCSCGVDFAAGLFAGGGGGTGSSSQRRIPLPGDSRHLPWHFYPFSPPPGTHTHLSHPRVGSCPEWGAGLSKAPVPPIPAPARAPGAAAVPDPPNSCRLHLPIPPAPFGLALTLHRMWEAMGGRGELFLAYRWF